MASSDGLEKYAIALADPTSPVERARVEQVDQTVIVNDGSTPAAPPRSTEPAGDAANAAAGGADGIEWQPADSKSPTLPPSRISRNAPAPAVPAEAQAILGALAPAEEERPHETASSGRRRLYFGLGLGAVLMAGAVTLLVARSGDTTEPGRRAEPPRAASETAPPPRPPARQPDEGRAPEAPVPAASSSAPAPSPAPPPEPSPLVKPKRIPAKPPARPAARSPAGEAPPPPPPGDDNPY